MENASETAGDPKASLAETGKPKLAVKPITPAGPGRGGRGAPPSVARGPAVIVTFIVTAIVGLTLWYLIQPQPLVIQGEADATRIDIAARVEGRVGKRPVERGDNVAAGAVLYEIDNPELLTSLRQAEAAKAVAEAQLANILAGTRAEVIAQRKASVESAAANLTLAQLTYQRAKTPVAEGHAP